MDLGAHAHFILSAYAAYAIVLGGLAAWLYVDGRQQKQTLEDLEARGIRRRSASRERRS